MLVTMRGILSADSDADDGARFLRRIKKVITTNNPDQARLIAGGFQSRLVKCLERILVSDEGVGGARSGFGEYTSSRATFDDLRKVLSALRVPDAIVGPTKRCHPKTDDFKVKSVAKVRGFLEALARS
jgi:hypothetical protein